MLKKTKQKKPTLLVKLKNASVQRGAEALFWMTLDLPEITRKKK